MPFDRGAAISRNWVTKSTNATSWTAIFLIGANSGTIRVARAEEEEVQSYGELRSPLRKKEEEQHLK